ATANLGSCRQRGENGEGVRRSKQRVQGFGAVGPVVSVSGRPGLGGGRQRGRRANVQIRRAPRRRPFGAAWLAPSDPQGHVPWPRGRGGRRRRRVRADDNINEGEQRALEVAAAGGHYWKLPASPLRIFRRRPKLPLFLHPWVPSAPRV
ncbi:hypothetical protein HPB47_011195, partial [Ixodes persulcatus]